MSNTVIQIKRSTSTAVPASLNAAEPAYSYVSNKLFLGDSSGTGVIAIGGQFFVDQQNTIFDIANAAFNKANTGDTAAIAGAFNTANAAYNTVNAVSVAASAGYDFANSVSLVAIAANLTGNAAYDKANSANVFAYNNSLAITAGYDTANAAFLNSNNAFNAANAGFDKANVASAAASAAYDEANTKLSTSGGTITGDLAIVGNLAVSGNTSYINVQNYRVEDPLIYLAGNNYVSDIVDIGFIGNYVNSTGSNVHTGLFRNHEDKEYYLFYGYDQEPENNHIDPNGNNFTIAVLNADLRTSNLSLGGQNAITWITSAYDQANTATSLGGLAFNAANAGFDKANTAATAAGAAYDQANTATTIGSAGFDKANSAATAAGSAYDQANTGTTIASSAFDKANTADTNAANASYLSTGTVPSSVVSGSYSGITGLGTITSGVWNGSTVEVPYGGTGRTTFTSNGILYGNTAGPLNVTAAGTEGQVLQASASGVPQFGMLDGGSF